MGGDRQGRRPDRGTLTTAGHDHGDSPAAWTVARLIPIGSAPAGLGLVPDSGLGFCAGLVVMAGGAAVGKVMQMWGSASSTADHRVTKGPQYGRFLTWQTASR
ncbi:HGxxPAAW family protein [Nonomuraea sp. bgisy101]|uniref:HGxxPAAW family protein n=1 Tax=unclassified Nonomuraea TaxID=2593643 RepID=UPI003D716C30